MNHITSFGDKVQLLKCENDEDFTRSAGVQRNTFEKCRKSLRLGCVTLTDRQNWGGQTEYVHITTDTSQSPPSTRGCLYPPLGGERPYCARFALRFNLTNALHHLELRITHWSTFARGLITCQKEENIFATRLIIWIPPPACPSKQVVGEGLFVWNDFIYFSIARFNL